MRWSAIIALVVGFSLSLTTTIAFAFDQARLRAELDEVLDSAPTARRTTVALKVVDLASGDVLFDRHGEKLLTPASNLKIYTSACALDVFGPNHCFPTRITARVDKQTGIIHGDLTLVGGGNAMLSGEELKSMADRIVAEWSVRQLHGNVVVDNSRYSNVQLGPGWMWDDQPHYFNMRVTPLMVDYNVAVVPDKIDGEGKAVRRAVEDPQTWVVNMFAEMLRSRGVKFKPAAVIEEVPKTGLRTIAHQGVDLAAMLKHFNHKSENAVGEVLLHEIAVANGVVRPTWPNGAKLITNWLHESAGLERGSFKLVDGSGLSRYNLISADSSVKLLAFMRRQRHYETFFGSLPIYEVDTGQGDKRELVHAKPGGMSGVSTISGYLQTLEGRQLAFSLLGNGFIGTSEPVQALRGEVWRVLVQYQRAAGN